MDVTQPGEINVKFVEDIAEEKEVDDKEEGPQDRSQVHTCSNEGRDDSKGSTATEERPEPV